MCIENALIHTNGEGLKKKNKKKRFQKKSSNAYPEVDGLGTGLRIHKSGKLAGHRENSEVWWLMMGKGCVFFKS
jgi:hypothetical protein